MFDNLVETKKATERNAKPRTTLTVEGGSLTVKAAKAESGTLIIPKGGGGEHNFVSAEDDFELESGAHSISVTSAMGETKTLSIEVRQRGPRSCSCSGRSVLVGWLFQRGQRGHMVSQRVTVININVIDTTMMSLIKR